MFEGLKQWFTRAFGDHSNDLLLAASVMRSTQVRHEPAQAQPQASLFGRLLHRTLDRCRTRQAVRFWCAVVSLDRSFVLQQVAYCVGTILRGEVLVFTCTPV